MCAALVVCHGMDFIDNHGFHVPQNRAAFLGGEKDVQRLGSSHQNMRRPLQHGAALVHQRVPGAHRGANLRHQQTALPRHLQDFSERDFQVFLNVVAQSFQRRDVEDFSPVVQIARQRLAHQAINAGQKCGEGLARTGGR